MVDPRQSNVLFVVLDTVRRDHLGPYGYDRGTTPELSAFSEEATVFESAIAPAPWTLPVHASMFTGRYPSQHGADQGSPYLEDVDTLASIVSGAGYDTACYSSNAWITPYTGLTDGFDSHDVFFEVLPSGVFSEAMARAWRVINDDERLRTIASRLVRYGDIAHTVLAKGARADSKTPAVIDRTMSFIEDSESDRGWFAFVNLMDAHLPYHPPDLYRETFAPGVDPDAICQNSKDYNSGARDVDEDEWDAIRGLYDAEIAHMDAEVGRLFEWLRETDQWEKTTVVVCADHGELHGEHSLFGHEFAVYDELIHVPLLVKHPALERDRRSDLVELLDCYHTILDVLDVDPTAIETKGDVQPRDRTRSILSDMYRDFSGCENLDPGQRAVVEAGTDHAFVEYASPIIEIHHLERKANEAGIELPSDHRAYSRFRAARGLDAKYIRSDRIADERYLLNLDSDEYTPIALADDDLVERTEYALSCFEDAVGVAWLEPSGERPDGTGKLSATDEKTKNRLRELGYLE